MNVSCTGIELIVDFYGVDKCLLHDQSLLTRVFREILDRNNFKIIKEYSHKFCEMGEGVTGIFLLSESHATFHTYPEWGALAINVFSCGKADPRSVISDLILRFNPSDLSKKEINRTFLQASVLNNVY